MHKKALNRLNAYIAQQGLRSTTQREKILDVFISAGRHLSAEELYLLMKSAHPGIGYATVYRTLKLLAGAGLAQERRFDDGFTRYEHTNARDHHDHLICTRCGAIIEFENERIEVLQQDVARKHKFQVENHKLEIYGICNRCSRGVNKSARTE